MNDYDATVASAYVRHRRIHPELLRRLIVTSELGPASTVLELGCGTGNYLSALDDLVGCTWHGLDSSEAMLAEARLRAPKARCWCAPAEQTGIAAGQYDLLFAVDVVHHLADRARAFRECRRLLRPDGKLCIATDSPEIISSREPLATYFPGTVTVDLARYPHPDTLRAELRAAGFSSIAEELVEFRSEIEEIEAYRQRTFSCLRLITDKDFEQGIARLERALCSGPVPLVSRYLLLWVTNTSASNRVA
jgi:ubiquinone/menaquinone biosynthesis C-methylase UbiE